MKNRFLSMVLILCIAISAVIAFPLSASAYSYDQSTLNSISISGGYVTACNMSINMYGYQPGTGSGSGVQKVYITLWSKVPYTAPMSKDLAQYDGVIGYVDQNLNWTSPGGQWNAVNLSGLHWPIPAGVSTVYLACMTPYMGEYCADYSIPIAMQTLQYYTVTTSSTGLVNASIALSENYVKQGESTNVTVTPNINTYWGSPPTITATNGTITQLSDMDGDGVYTGKLSNITNNSNITVLGNAVYPSITINDGPGVGSIKTTVSGSISGNITSCSKAVGGETITVTPGTPASGYKLKEVKYNDGTDHVLTLAGGKYTFTMPKNIVTVSAAYESDAFSASVTVNKNGSTWTDVPGDKAILSTSGTDATVGQKTGTPSSGVFSFTDLTASTTYYVWVKNNAGAYVNCSSVSFSNKSSTVSYYDVNLTKGTGIETLTGGGTYLSGETAKISAALLPGYTWDKWSDNHTTQTDRSITVDKKYDLTAGALAIPATPPTTVSTTSTALTYGYTSGSISVTATPGIGHTITDYQWYTCNSDGSNKAIISGANSATYAIPTKKNVGSYYYACEVTITRTDNSQTTTVTTSPATWVRVYKRPVTVRMNNISRDYGSANPAFDFTITNGSLVNGDTNADLAVTGSTPAIQTSNAGSYDITGTSASANYEVTITKGTLTINKKASQTADFTYDLTSKTYNGNAQDITVAPKSGTASIAVKYDGASAAPTEPGTYAVTIDVSDATNYQNITNLSLGNYTINKADAAGFTLTSSKNPSAYEEEVTFTATVVKTGNGAIPTGNITFTSGGTTVLATVALTDGAATFKKSDLPASANSITAEYSGDSRYHAKTSNVIPQAITKKTIRFTIENTGYFYESGAPRTVKIADTGSLLTENDFTVSYYRVDENEGALSGTTPVKNAVTAGKYLYVIDFKTAQSNYEITRKFSVSTTDLPNIASYDNAGYMDIKAAQSGQQKPISFAEGSAGVYVTDGIYKNTLTNENASSITYRSSNDTIASVSADGTVTIKKAGTVTITATSTMADTMPVYASYVLTISKKTVTVTAQNDTCEFGSAWDKSAGVTYSDSLMAGDFTGSIDFDTKYTQGARVGEYTITPTGLSSDKYEITFVPGALTVTPKILAASNFAVSAADKTYDGATGATVTANIISGIYSGNSVKAEATGSFTSANAADSANVTYTITGLIGKDADNYALAGGVILGGTTAKISPATVYVICPANTTRTFDGNPQAVEVTAMANGAVFDASNYTVQYSGNTSAVDVGVYPVSIVLSDSVKGNYTVHPFIASLTIKSAAQDVFSIENVPNAVYYGDTFTVSAEGGQDGVVSYSVSGNAAINSSTGAVTVTGTGKITVTATKTITGYQAKTATRSFTAMPKVITPVSNIAGSMTYNAGTDVDVSISFAAGEIVGADEVAAMAVATRMDANAGNDKLVYVKNIALMGADKANYVLAYTTLQDSINVMPIAVHSFTVVPDNKVYDGTTKAQAKVTAIDGVLADDLKDISIIGSAVFDKADTTATKVIYTIESMTGAKAGNYSFVQATSEAAASISKAKIDFSAGASTFIYDGKQKNIEITGSNGTGRFTDFTVKYDNDTTVPSTVGVYSVSISFNDPLNYETDFKSFYMEIISADQDKLVISGMPGTLDYGKGFTLTATGGSYSGGMISWASSDNSIATADRDTGKVQIVGVGREVTITATKSGGANYNDETAAVTFTPVAKQASFRITDLSSIYNAAAKPVTVTPSDANMIENVDYTVTYYDENSQRLDSAPTNAGTYYAEVTTVNDKYSGLANAAITIKKASISGVTVAQNDGVYQTALADAAISGMVPAGVTSKITYIGSGISSQQSEKPTNAGDYTVIATLTGDNYETYTTTNIFTIARKILTVNDFKVTANDKIYDESITAALSATTLNITDDVKAEVIGGFTKADAGDSVTVSYAITGLTGKDADNYTLDQHNASGTTAAKISPATVSVICASNTTRTFDAMAQSVDVSAMANGAVFDSSNYSVKYSGADSAINVGVYDITVVLTSSNYVVKPFSATLTIKEASQEVFAIENVPDRVYYGDSFKVSAQDASGTVTYEVNGGAPALIDNSGNFVATGVGTVKITATSTKEGYTTRTVTKTFTVYPRVVTPAVTAAGRVYNAQKNVDITVDLENVMASDSITATATGIMANADAGADKMVYVSGIVLDGAKKAFYTLGTTSLQTTVTIGKADISGFSISAQDKTYDGSIAANAAVTVISGVYADDLGQVAIAGDAAFDNETAGADKRVTYTAMDLTGAKASNYQFANEAAKTSIATADISPMNIGFIIGTATFQYDGRKKEVITSASDEFGRVFTNYTVEYWQDGSLLNAHPNEAGDYTVKIVLDDSINYTTAQADIPMAIAQANQEQLAIMGLPSTIEYSDEFTLEAIGGSGSGNVEWESDSSYVTVDESGTVRIDGAVGAKVTITATKKDDGNFTEKSAKAVFMPSAKTTSFALDDLTQVYSGDGKEITVTPDVGSATYAVAYNGSPELPTDAGIYSVTVTANGNYKGTATTILTISKAKMSGLRVAQADCTYGEALPDAVFDTAASGVNVRISYSTLDGQKPVKAGDYMVTATYTGANYETFTASSSFKIEKRILTVKAKDAQRKYGEANPVFTLVYDGFVNGENEINLLSEPVATTAATASSPVSDYAITVSGGKADNYAFYYDNSGSLKVTGAVGGNFYITGANNSVTAGDIFTLHAYYDNAKPAVSWQSSDETVAAVDANGTVTVLKKGEATITAVITDPNYQSGISAQFKLNASKKTIQLKPADLVKVYNAERQDIVLVSDDAGFVPTLAGEHKNIDITYTLTTDASVTEPKQAGVYTVTYTINHPSYTGGETVTMYINKAAVTVRAHDLTKVYGEENPAYYITGLIGADESGADYIAKITGMFYITSDADSTGAKTNASEYPITLAVKEGRTLNDDGNYNLVISGVKGKLTVTKAPLTVKVSDASREYGAENVNPACEYVGFVVGETENDLIAKPVFSYDADVSRESNAGNYPDVITASGAQSNNYEFSYSYTDGTGANLTIHKRPVTVSAGTARGSYLTVNFDKGIAGLTKDSFVVTLGDAPVQITSVSANNTNTAYTLNGSFKTGSEYAVAVNVSDNYELAGLPLTITPKSSGGGGGGGGGSITTSYKITVTQAAGGKISPDTVSVNENGSKTFTITPNDGYEIEDVLVNGKSVGAVKEYTFDKVTASAGITAKFKKIEEKPATPTEQPAPEKWENPFADINEKDWFYEAARYVNENGLMNGTDETTFAPNLEVTRAMFVTVLYRAEKQPYAGISLFTDIENGSYYEKAIAWAAANGIVKGVSETEFAPDGTITREQMAAIIQRYAIFKGLDAAANKTAGYSDSVNISDYAKEAVAFCTEHGIMSGKDSNIFDPLGYATRAEVAAVLERVLKILQ